MKRIVDGLTYNTETSILLAKAEWNLENQRSPYNGAECEGRLYQTRGGAFFLVTTIRLADRNHELKEKVEFAPMTAERAQAWLLEGDVEVYRNHFEDPPEAAADGTGATLYIRVPAALKWDVDEAARKAKVSGNVWAMRCVERCLEGFPDEMTAIWAIARGLTAPWSSDKPPGHDAELDSYKFATAVKALNKIGDLVEYFAEMHFGTPDLSKISNADRFLDGPEGASLNRRFQPYPQTEV